jgi:hypothetical protein
MRKKITLLCSVLALFAVQSFAQSYAFYYNDVELEDNAEITVSRAVVDTVLEGWLVLEPNLQLKNLTNTAMNTGISQKILEYPALDEEDEYTGYLSLCFVFCFTRNEDRTFNVVLAPNAFAEGFHSKFNVQEGVYTSAKVKYEVYAWGDIFHTDKKTITVNYVYDENSTNGLKNPAAENAISVFQEGNNITFNYALDAQPIQLDLYNISGQKIGQHLLASGNGTFTLPSTLAKGIYVYSVKNAKGMVTTNKFSVQ